MQNYYQNNQDQDFDEPNKLNQTPPEKQPNSLGRNQRIAAGVLAVFAIMIIGLWMVQFRSSLSQPFAYQGGQETNEQSGTCTGPDCAEQTKADLLAKDTDGDGLNDWEELNTYNTSPYLADSDSDSFNDKNEIDSNNDPNCPTGRDCYSNGLLSAQQGTENSTEQNQTNSSLDAILNQAGYGQGTSTPETGSDTAEIGAMLGENLDAATLRQLLLENGMSKEVLDQISDEVLMESFKEIAGN